MQTFLISLFGLLAVFGNISANLFETISDVNIVKGQQTIFENFINNTINEKATQLRAHDPLRIEHQAGKVSGYSFLIENATIRGFSNMYASHIKLTGIFTWYLELILELPHITGSLQHWKSDSEVFYGDGNASFEINNLKMTVKAKMGIFNKKVKDTKVTPHIGKANVFITGVYNDKELSQIITDSFDYVLNDFVNNNAKFHYFLSKIAYNVLNKN